jgi:hypothetical protein
MGCEVFDGAGHFHVVAGDFHDGILYSMRNEATSQARLDVQFAVAKRLGWLACTRRLNPRTPACFEREPRWRI